MTAAFDAPAPAPPLLDLDALARAVLHGDPFPHVVVPNFVTPTALAAVDRDSPKLDLPGSFPLASLSFGPVFGALARELEGEALRAVAAKKLGLNLSGRPTTLTARAVSQAKDGRVHTDSTSKMVTALLYLNTDWRGDGGCLRLLRSRDLEDCAKEIKPEAGTLLMFINGPRAFHGHKPFVGRRRTLQLNWVTGRRFVVAEHLRHRLSAVTKQLSRH